MLLLSKQTRQRTVDKRGVSCFVGGKKQKTYLPKLFHLRPSHTGRLCRAPCFLKGEDQVAESSQGAKRFGFFQWICRKSPPNTDGVQTQSLFVCVFCFSGVGPFSWRVFLLLFCWCFFFHLRSLRRRVSRN